MTLRTAAAVLALGIVVTGCSAHSTPRPAPTPAPWTGTRLAVGMLAAKEFGPGFTVIDNGLSDTGSVIGNGAVPTPVAQLGCYWTVNGALRSGPISKADEYVADPSAHGSAIGAHAYAFLPGAASATLTAERTALASCKDFKTTVGTAKLQLTEHVTTAAVSGLGAEAFEIDDRESSTAYGTHYIRILIARYGDVVLWDSLDTTDQHATASYDLGDKVRRMASKLGLH